MVRNGSHVLVASLMALSTSVFILTGCGHTDLPANTGFGSSGGGQSTLEGDGTGTSWDSDYSPQQEEGYYEQRLDEDDYYELRQRQEEEDYYYEQRQRQQQEDDYYRQQQEDYYYEQQRQEDYYNQ